jgi:hypothetical protein
MKAGFGSWPPHPLPDGTLVQVVDHHARTVCWARIEKGEEIVCEPPSQWPVPEGYELVRPQ